MATRAVRTGNLFGPSWRESKTTAADGSVSFALPSGLFAKPPVCQLTGVTSDGRMVDVCLDGDPTATLIKAIARKNVRLPAVIGTLGALLNYDTSAPVQTTVHLIAMRSSV